ncbi:hypothetical protein [Oceanicola sp. 502str15]|uniref:hypothetical protein n=1 Tax=Rhodobacterales TaxID=204455 RepID=UPI0020965B6C|nr:hypothetical protein [Oceanicola sp. 502str15]
MSLDARLLAAHAARDGAALARLYAEAAEAGGPGAGFYLTQAWVFALEAGLPEAEAYARRLKAGARA